MVNMAIAVVAETVLMIAAFMAWRVASARFARLPYHKQWYVVGNVAKSACLATIMLSPCWWPIMYHGYYRHEWEIFPMATYVLKRSVVLYVVSDVTTLYLVPKMPTTTVVHHVLSAVFCTCIFFFDGRMVDSVTIMIGLYGAWSALAWPVNFFLAMRVVYPDQRWVAVLARVALLVYVCVCACNWTWHALWYASHVWRGTVTLFQTAYVALLPLIIRDDIVLMRWLWSYEPSAAAARYLAKRDDKRP